MAKKRQLNETAPRSKGGQLSSAQMMAGEKDPNINHSLKKRANPRSKRGQLSSAQMMAGEKDPNINHSLKKESKKSKKGGKKGPKAWGKNLYGEGKKKKKGSNSGSAMAKAGKLWPVLDGTDNILNFIKQMTEKNYAEANKYLHGALEDKTRARIAKAASQK